MRYSSPLFLLLFFAFPQYSCAEATLLFTPEKDLYAVDDRFSVDVVIDTGKDAINAAEAEITFDQKTLEVEGISVEGSILTSWSTTPVFSNQSAGIRFTGWAGKSFTGTSGHLLTIHFRARSSGLAVVQFLSGSALATDGRGSNVVTSMRNGVYTIQPKSVSSDPLLLAAPALNAAETGDPQGSVPQVLGTTSEIPAPEFTEYAGVLHRGESLHLKGITVPQAKVTIRINGQEGDVEESAVESFEDGSFTFVSAPFNETGIYRAFAEVRTKEGEHSEPTERIVITVKEKPPFFQAFLEYVIRFGPFIALILMTGLSIGYYFHRMSRHPIVG